MKDLQSTIQEALNKKEAGRFRMFGTPIFQSPVVNRDTVETTLDEILKTAQELEKVSQELAKAKKSGSITRTKSDPKHQEPMKTGDTCEMTRFGKTLVGTVIDWAWCQDRDRVIPVISTNGRDYAFPDLDTVWYKIDD